MNQQLTQTLVSQLLTQLQSLSPNSLSQLHNQLFLGTTTSPPLAQNSALVTNNIVQSLQNIQQGASQGQANIFQEAANGSRQPAVMPYITPRPAITTHHHPTFAGTQQQGNSKSLNNPAAGFLAELQRGHDAAVRQVLIRREAKKRKKRFAMPTQSSISLESGLSIVSSTSGARSKNQSDNDNEVSSSSTDLPTSDSPTKGCESSSSSDEEKDIRRVPLRKRFKASRNSGMTYRALQDHDERMARNDKM